MLQSKFDFSRFEKDASELNIDVNSSYLLTYPYLVDFFSGMSEIKRSDLIISSHFVYGWMPTTISLDLSMLDKVLLLLNKTKNGSKLVESEILTIKECINNSVIGTSKLLHFLCPYEYAIIDSRVMRYLTGKKSYYRLSKVSNYSEYLDLLNRIRSKESFSNIFNHVQNQVPYEISDLRAIELIMFETDRQKDEQGV